MVLLLFFSCSSMIIDIGEFSINSVAFFADCAHPAQVNVPRERNTFCKNAACRKHTPHKVSQYKMGARRDYSQGPTLDSIILFYLFISIFLYSFEIFDDLRLNFEQFNLGSFTFLPGFHFFSLIARTCRKISNILFSRPRVLVCSPSPRPRSAPL